MPEPRLSDLSLSLGISAQTSLGGFSEFSDGPGAIADLLNATHSNFTSISEGAVGWGDAHYEYIGLSDTVGGQGANYCMYLVEAHAAIVGIGGWGAALLNDTLARSAYQQASQAADVGGRMLLKMATRRNLSLTASTMSELARPYNIADLWLKSAATASKTNAAVNSAASVGGVVGAGLVGASLIMAGVDVYNASPGNRVAVANANTAAIGFGYLMGDAAGLAVIGGTALLGLTASPLLVGVVTLGAAAAGGAWAYSWVMGNYGK